MNLSQHSKCLLCQFLTLFDCDDLVPLLGKLGELDANHRDGTVVAEELGGTDLAP